VASSKAGGKSTFGLVVGVTAFVGVEDTAGEVGLAVGFGLPNPERLQEVHIRSTIVNARNNRIGIA